MPEAPKIVAAKTRRTCIFPPTFLMKGIVSRRSTRSEPMCTILASSSTSVPAPRGELSRKSVLYLVYTIAIEVGEL